MVDRFEVKPAVAIQGLFVLFGIADARRGHRGSRVPASGPGSPVHRRLAAGAGGRPPRLVRARCAGVHTAPSDRGAGGPTSGTRARLAVVPTKVVDALDRGTASQ